MCVIVCECVGECVCVFVRVCVCVCLEGGSNESKVHTVF